ncbi:MAG: hypothetical protein ACO3TH_12300, partial [Lutimaribacter sp.]
SISARHLARRAASSSTSILAVSTSFRAAASACSRSASARSVCAATSSARVSADTPPLAAYPEKDRSRIKAQQERLQRERQAREDTRDRGRA